MKIDLNGKLEPKEDIVVAICGKCHGEIYLGEEYGEDDLGGIICHDCIEDKWRDLTLIEKLDVFGYHSTEQVLAVQKVRNVWCEPLR